MAAKKAEENEKLDIQVDPKGKMRFFLGLSGKAKGGLVFMGVLNLAGCIVAFVALPVYILTKSPDLTKLWFLVTLIMTMVVALFGFGVSLRYCVRYISKWAAVVRSLDED